ncbi:hypothetical protein [Parerythrobacter aestuarii]|uniref:hypothetical protein n=1 Tax=Parerythrobacter aestuarii TaxID=3020909 RepID=UPI0024DE9DF7|nr:hypothetical protein [Parerythrobacter aestuarii]
MTQLRMFMAGAMLLLVAACNPMAELEDADAAVAQFHQRYDDGHLGAIWSTAADELRRAGSRGEFEATITRLMQVWGKTKSTEREGFNINTNNGVTTLRVTHTTQFEAGEATETFLFRRAGDGLLLQGYNRSVIPGKEPPVPNNAPTGTAAPAETS